ncbi:high mobility group protein 20A [Nasonia vitripennis]|uniref:HMG box domain-containing protein n=1 Tax=Nasonia vitripennis TaxID=7425 RepID=A0A7M7H6Y8_NASVI|nr:high mobility group protein 20A [Nasonia vitripennis]
MNEGKSLNNVSENSTEASHSNLNGGVQDLSNNKSSPVKSEKANDSVQENSTLKRVSTSSANNSTGKAKKRKRCPRDATAPKQPLTGYFRFLNDRREKVRSENPTMPFSEITRQLAAEWNVLPADIKQQYLDAAEQDKERYNREFNDYKQTDAYKLFLEKQATKKEKKNQKKEKESNGTDTSTAPPAASENNTSRKEKNEQTGTWDIPIFTEEFLEHNKSCEVELRQLRKNTADYESQNAVLQRHVDSLHTAVNRLETETNYQQTANEALQRHLDMLRSQLASCFANIPLTDCFEGATPQNIDSYVERLDSLVNTNTEPSLRSAVRTAVSRLDFIK